MKATQIAALVNEPPKRFLQINKTMIVINGNIFEHLSLVARARCQMNNRRREACQNKHITEVSRNWNEKQMNADHFNCPPKRRARASAVAVGTLEIIPKYFTELSRRLEAVESKLNNLTTEASSRTPQQVQRYQQTNFVFRAFNARSYGTRCWF